VALVGATLIDRTGTPPIADTRVLIEGQRIKVVGPATAIRVPTGARTIDVETSERKDFTSDLPTF
jgi:imidazolonepropionase-like amidohydrolase